MIINYELEKEIVGSLLKKPDLIQNVTIEDKWFTNPMYQQIFVTLSILDGKKDSLFDIYAYLQGINPETQITFNNLSEIEQSIVSTAHIERNVEVLRKQYLDIRLIEASRKAAESLDDEVKAELKDILSQIERLNISTDDGKLDETFETIEYMLENDGDYGIKTFGNLDFMLGGGLYGGMLVTIGARPGVGKTAFGAINLADRAVNRNKGIAVDVFTMEMGKREMVNRFISLHTGISTFKLRNPNKTLIPKEKQAVRDCLTNLGTYNLRVHDTSSTLQDIRSQIKARVFAHGDKPYLCVVDYLGLIRTKDKKKDRRLEIEDITRELKILANELNIVIILLSQLSRGVEHRQNKTPILSDLRESGSIEQDSNVVGFLHRPEDSDDDNLIELVIQKSREGSLGTLRFDFDGTKMKFEERYE